MDQCPARSRIYTALPYSGRSSSAFPSIGDTHKGSSAVPGKRQAAGLPSCVPTGTRNRFTCVPVLGRREPVPQIPRPENRVSRIRKYHDKLMKIKVNHGRFGELIDKSLLFRTRRDALGDRPQNLIHKVRASLASRHMRPVSMCSVLNRYVPAMNRLDPCLQALCRAVFLIGEGPPSEGPGSSALPPGPRQLFPSEPLRTLSM